MAKLRERGEEFLLFIMVIHQGEGTYPPSRRKIKDAKSTLAAFVEGRGKFTGNLKGHNRKGGFMLSIMFVISCELLDCSLLMES